MPGSDNIKVTNTIREINVNGGVNIRNGLTVDKAYLSSNYMKNAELVPAIVGCDGTLVCVADPENRCLASQNGPADFSEVTYLLI